MSERGIQPDNEAPKGFKGKPPEFLNYFGRERWIHVWLMERRTRLISAVVPLFARIGLAPDTISYTGLALLTGVVIYFVRKPILAVYFLAGHLICDGLDGAFARHSGKASQSGAFTDLCCDQLGMVVVATLAIFHHMVSPVLGAVYITLYLIVVVFGVIINVMGIGARITITSKYFLYIVYGIWAFKEINLFSPLMSFFSVIMAAEVLVGYLRLKRGLRRKYDSAVKFGEGDPYSSKLNYAVNVFIPLAVLVAVLTISNLTLLKAMFERPTMQAKWTETGAIFPESSAADIRAVGAKGDKFLVLTWEESLDAYKTIEISIDGEGERKSFTVPGYVDPGLTVFPVDGNIMLLPDRTNRLVMGIDLDASFASRRAVMVFTVPLGWLRMTGMGVGERDGSKVWFAANYMYTRKTYVVDPTRALKTGSIMGGKVAAYVNAGFPSGLAVVGDTVIEYNRSPLKGLFYVAGLDRVVKRSNLLDLAKISFAPPEEDVLGPMVMGEDLIVLSRQGRVFRLPLASFLQDRKAWKTTPVERSAPPDSDHAFGE